jgi:predicted phosphodiesterase
MSNSLVKKLSEQGWRTNRVERLLISGLTISEIAKREHLQKEVVDNVAQRVIERLAREVRALKAESKLLEEEKVKLENLLDQQRVITSVIQTACESLRPFPIQYRPASSKKTQSSAVLVLSDWHIGEKIKPDEVEGVNAFNLSIAQRRVQNLGERFLHNIDTMRGGFQIDDCHVFALGDFISGNIHHELVMHNEFPPPVQAVKAGNLLANLLMGLAPHFRTVVVECNEADNHGRLFPKPMAKGKTQNNYNVVVYAVAQALCAAQKNIVFNIHSGMKQVVEVQGTRFLLQHGDTIRAWMGIPHYGIEREKNREKIKREVLKKIQRLKYDIRFDVMVIGHFHMFGWEEEIIRNGSLSGTAEYDHASGRFAIPHQVSFLVHRKYGVHTFNRWRVA